MASDGECLQMEDGIRPEMPILPEEVWEKILLKNLDSLDGLRNAVNTSKQWRRILHPYRTLWLFPEVLPLIAKYIEKEDALSCRLVCHSWSQGVDEYIESALNPQPYDEDDEKKLKKKRFIWEFSERSPYRFRMDWDYDNRQLVAPDSLTGTQVPFQLAMANHPRNPFIVRAVEMRFHDAQFNSYNEHFAEASLFPSLFGRHIKHLDLLCDTNIGICPVAINLYATIRHMPELIQLRVKGNLLDSNELSSNSDMELLELSSGSDEEPLELISRRDEELLEEVQNDIFGEHSLPHFDKLTTLQIQLSNFKVSPELFGKLLLEKCCGQLRKLELNWWHWSLSGLHWTNLTDLKISFEGAPERNPIELESSVLGTAKAPKLKNLQISFSEGSVDRRYYEMLANMLRDWPNLKSLWVSHKVCKCRSDGWWPLPWTWLPKRLKSTTLQYLTKLTVNHKPISKRFLQLFPNLRHVHFSVPELSHQVSHREDYLPIPYKYSCDYKEGHPIREMIYEKSCGGECWWMGSKPEMESHSNWFTVATVADTLGLFSLSSLEELSVGSHIRSLTRSYQRNDQIYKGTLPSEVPKPVTPVTTQLSWRTWRLPRTRKDLYFSENKSQNFVEICKLSMSEEISKEILSAPRKWYWDWDTFDYGFSLWLLRLIPFRHSLHLEANSPNFVTADFWMKKVAEFQEMFPTVKSISFSHSPVSKDFLLCFPNVEILQLPSHTAGVGHYFSERWDDPILYDYYDQTCDVLKREKIRPIKSVEESEVWTLLPNLQKVTLMKIDKAARSIEPLRTYNRP